MWYFSSAFYPSCWTSCSPEDWKNSSSSKARWCFCSAASDDLMAGQKCLSLKTLYSSGAWLYTWRQSLYKQHLQGAQLHCSFLATMPAYLRLLCSSNGLSLQVWWHWQSSFAAMMICLNDAGVWQKAHEGSSPTHWFRFLSLGWTSWVALMIKL